MLQFRRWLLVATVLGVSWFSAHAGEPKKSVVVFPGDRAELASPMGNFLLKNIDLDSPDAEGMSHHLVLVDRKSGKERVVYSYGRSVDVMWAPDDGWLAVNDAEGSDLTRCRIIDPRRPEVLLDVFDAMSAARPEQFAVGNFDHGGVVCTGWLAGDAVRVKGYGYRPGVFCLTGIFDVAGGTLRALADCPAGGGF